VIYVIDPDSNQRDQLLKLFERTGYEAVSYPSAEEFLATDIDPAKVGCIISEMELPGVDGLELLSVLRQRNSELPVIILTDDPDVNRAVTALRNKVLDYIVKPMVERDLIGRVKIALRLAKQIHNSRRTDRAK